MELFMDMRLTPEAKAQLERTWRPVCSGPGDPRAKQTLSLLRLVLALTGELAVGVTGQQDGLPLVLALVEQADAEDEALSPRSAPSKPLRRTTKSNCLVPVPMTPPIRYGFIGNTAISNDLAAPKAPSTARPPAEQTYFASLQPPLGATPRYMVAVSTERCSSRPPADGLARPTRGSPNAAAALSTAAEKLREVRLLQERRGSWLDQSLSIRLN
jgi:hypothetical protein